MKAAILTACALLVYLVGAWFLPPWLGLHGQDVWLLRGGLALIGVIGAVAFLWMYNKIAKENAASLQTNGVAGADAGADALLRDAEARLKTSKLGRGASIKTLPLIFFIGDSGSSKTSTVIHSDMDPELLAGQVHQASEVVPTRAANVWFAKNHLVVEVGTEDSSSSAWSRLLKYIRPSGIGLFRKEQPPRAAVVCVSSELFLHPGSTAAIPAAVQRLRSRLDAIARSSGASFPVYVLFTKTDKIPFFAEFTRHLTNDQARQVLGATLPLRTTMNVGVYGDEEARRLNDAFNDLVLSLADQRLDLLTREHNQDDWGRLYEFPRELRKLRPAAVSLLVDLCRPSSLRATPFLRGFYFSGVRAVNVTEAAKPAAPRPQDRALSPLNADATGILTSGKSSFQQEGLAQPQALTTRRVPQWTFLSRLFNDVLLKDHVAMSAAARSLTANLVQRCVLVGAAIACLLLAVACAVSYVSNSALESEVLAALRETSLVNSSAAMPSPAALQQLENIRQSLDTLKGFQRNGAPLHLRWGLYKGTELYPHARFAYFRAFHSLLFDSTQTAILKSLKGLPPSPAPGDDYGRTYDSLKAYLITTSNHDKSIPSFLSPVLLKSWPANTGSTDPELLLLAQKQFDFYAEELKDSNPFSSEADSSAVEKARRYLSEFAGVERVYRLMLAEAKQKNPSIIFNKQFPGSADVLVNAKEVSGPFTKSGWTFMQDAIKNAERFFAGEQWVLGTSTVSGLDRGKLEQDLKDRYTADFIDQWQQFLRASTVVRYTNVKDAAAKLNRLSNNQTPLLALFCVVSQNTAVDSEQVKTAFQAVQSVVPPNCADKYIGDSNAPYMQALVGLTALIEQISNSPGGSNDALGAQALASAVQAKIVTRQVAQKFRIDPTTHLESVVQKLMEDPITSAEVLIRNVAPAELNGKAKAFCSQFGDLMTKYPFNSGATRQATLAEVNTMFQPSQGTLWMFFDANLQKQLVRQGTQFVPNANAGISINPAFLTFWNRAVAFSDALYSDSSGQPHLTYSLRLSPVPGIENVSLTIDGQAISTSGANAGSKQYVWSGNPKSEVKLTGKLGPTELVFATYDGLWAPFQFFGDADRWTTNGSLNTLEWVPRQGRSGRAIALPDGSALTIRFELDMGKSAAVFQKAFLSSLSCTAEVAR